MTDKTAGKPGNSLPMYRLTLTAEVLALAISKKSPIAGKVCIQRPDGKFDCAIKMSVAGLLKQLAHEKENLSDTALRVLTGQAGEATLQ